MKTNSVKFLSLMLAVLFVVSGCSSAKFATDYSGLTTPAGKPVAHVSQSNIALHLLVGKKPLVGDASLATTVAEFTAAAKSQGATQVRIVQSNSRAWWFIMFPFSLLVTPVTSNVAGDAI